MNVKTPTPRRAWKQVPVLWQDSAWFPIVGRLRPPPRRQVNWPAPIITDLTGCFARDVSLIKL